LENLNTAFDVAEKHLNIPRMLDAEGKFPHLFSLLASAGFSFLVYTSSPETVGFCLAMKIVRNGCVFDFIIVVFISLEYQ